MITASTKIRERMEKVRALMDSPNPGEAAAAREKYAELQAKYASFRPEDGVFNSDSFAQTGEAIARAAALRQQHEEWIASLASQAVDDLLAKGYVVLTLGDGWYIAPSDDVGRVLHRGDDPLELVSYAATIPPAAEYPA